MLVDENTLSQLLPEIEDVISPYVLDYAVDFKSPVYGEAFKFYVLFTHCPDWLNTRVCDLGDPAVFHNRIFWFARFRHLYCEQHGPDEGLAQQEFQLLEESDHAIDWPTVERIMEMAKTC